jgi:hypothetical protein
MFLKGRSGENGNRSQETEKGFGLEKIDEQKYLSFYTQLSRFERYKTITAAPVWPIFYGKKFLNLMVTVVIFWEDFNLNTYMKCLFISRGIYFGIRIIF